MGTRIRFGEVWEEWVIGLVGHHETSMRSTGGLAKGCRKEKGKYFDCEKDYEHINHLGRGGGGVFKLKLRISFF
jgi:hypothetical protein